MKLNEFLSQHAVFTVEELDRFLTVRGTGNPSTRKSLLTYYRNQERIIPVRRGLWATVPVGSDPILNPMDPYLVAAKMRGMQFLHTTRLWIFTEKHTRFTRGSITYPRKNRFH